MQCFKTWVLRSGTAGFDSWIDHKVYYLDNINESWA